MACAAGRKLRVLCMHGYRTNAAVMRDQTRGLRRALEPHAEFVFLEGPIEARGPSEAVLEQRYAASKPFFEWGAFKELRPPNGSRAEDNSDEQHGDGGWYHEYTDFERLVAFMDERLPALGPIDAVVGFSQGAQMATALSMWYLHHHGKRWWKCAVLVCGPRVRGVAVRPAFEHPDGSPKRVPIPSVHIVGKQDQWYQGCIEMAGMYEDHPEGAPAPKAVFEHDTGHRFPSGERHDPLYDEVARLVRAHCGHDD